MTLSKGEVRDHLQPQFDGHVVIDDTTWENDLYVEYCGEDLSEIDVPNGWRMESTPDGIVFNQELPEIDGIEMEEQIPTPVAVPDVYVDHAEDVWLQDGEGAVLVGGGVVDDLIAALEEA